MAAFTYPLNAWLAEPAGVRFARLCQENGIQPRVDGVSGFTVPMGYQIPDTLMNLLQACEDTDRGQIYEPRDFLGLAYRTLDSLQSQPVALTLDYNQDHMTPPLEPTDDDLYIVNDVTAINQNSTSAFSGSSAVATLNDGSAMSIGVIGDYANTYDVNTVTDATLPDEAGWILHTGTGTDERYPSVVVNLASTQPQVQAINSAVQALDIGAHAQIVNTPSFLPPGPVDLLVFGYTENLGDFCDEINFSTIPETPYEVAIADTSKASPISTTLGTGFSPGATSFTTAAGSDTWTTSAGDMPIVITLAGATYSVTGISGTVAPQTFTINPVPVNGISKTHAAGEVITLYKAAIAALVA
jgi:hypothetical protein